MSALWFVTHCSMLGRWAESKTTGLDGNPLRVAGTVCLTVINLFKPHNGRRRRRKKMGRKEGKTRTRIYTGGSCKEAEGLPGTN